MTRKSLTIASLALSLAFTLSLASILSAHSDSLEMLDQAATKKTTTFEGTLVCTACSLKKSGGANAQCKVYGHDHSLLTKDGKYIAFLPNQNSAVLIEGEQYNKKSMTVRGVFFASANLLDVESFTVDGKTIGWCEKDGAMDDHGAH